MDLCHVQSARAAGEVGRVCTELLFGYRRHPAWDGPDRASCYVADELDALEDVIPGIAATARFYSDVVEIDGFAPRPRPDRAPTPAARAVHAHAREDGRMPHRIASRKDRAAEALTQVAIDDAPGYPLPEPPRA